MPRVPSAWLPAAPDRRSCASSRPRASGKGCRPPVVLVYDFAVDPDDVVVDTFGPAFLGGSDTDDERKRRGYEVADAFAQRLVVEFRARGIPTDRATPAMRPPLHAVLVKGQFVSMNEGDQAGRVVIGFGRGSTGLRIQAQVYQVTERGLRRIDEGEAEAYGSKKPGVAVPVAGGAAAGTAATSAVISAGMVVMSESKGGLDADIARLAETCAERAAEFYRRQGWL